MTEPEFTAVLVLIMLFWDCSAMVGLSVSWDLPSHGFEANHPLK